MLYNRLMPPSSVIPVLAYPDAPHAAERLCEAFGFTVRVRIGTHRIQLNAGDGALIIREFRPGEADQTLGLGTSLMVRVENADAHCRRAKQCGVQIIDDPTTHPYGERQYTAIDFAGRAWTFSQSVADVAPEIWDAIADQPATS